MRRLALFLGLLALAPALRAESVAVVVGVAGYPKLEPRAKLKGTLLDADAIGAVLKGYGFSVRPLRDKDATKEGILAALAQAAKDCKPGDRFVFYFAGHGRNKPSPSIGPYDADRPGLAWLGADELNLAVKAVPAASRTVILDACFSGAMIKDFSEKVSARFYVPDALTKSAGYDDDAEPKKNSPIPTKDDGVCYLAAAGAGQIAQEAVAPPDNPQGERRGVFSYYLERQLSAKPQPASWGAAVEGVQASMIRDQVKLELFQPQNPQVSNPYAQRPLFQPSAVGSAPKPPAPTSVLKLLAADRPDATVLSLVAPGEKALRVGQPCDIKVERHDPGYLFVAEQVGGAFRRIYPAQAESADELFVDAGTPSGRFRLLSDVPGNVVIKAFLLEDKAAAEALFAAMPEGKLVGGDAEAVVKEAMAAVTGFVTATLSVRVGDDLLEGLQVKDAPKAWAALRGTGDLSQALQASLRRSGFPRLAERALSAPPDDRLLRVVLNLVLSDRTLAANLALAKVPLGELAPSAQERDESGAPKRNAKLLVKLFDGALAPASP